MRWPWLSVCWVVLVLGVPLRLWDRYATQTLRVVFFDVGQGDATAVRFPTGAYWLVDAGGGYGAWDRGRDVILPELARAGVLRVERVLLTHPDLDHGYGFRGVLEHLQVGELVWNASFAPAEHPLLDQLVRQARNAGVRRRAVAKTEHSAMGGAKVVVEPLKAGRSKNNLSLVLWLEYGGCRVFLGGDAEALAEQAILQKDARRVDVLKVNHHGSKTSSTPAFLEKMDPFWAVIAVGRGNRYGHPAKQVLARLRRYAPQILRTDFHGYVQMDITAQGKIRCRSALGACGSVQCR